MTLDPLEQLDLSELPDYDADAEYGALLRALRRQQGFGILFVRCSPSQGKQLIADLKKDLPQKRCAELTLTEPLVDGDFFGCAAEFVAEHPAEVVFVQGMEHSLLDYEETRRQSGWTKAEIQNYSWKDVPPILRNLNQQRDRFRNELPVCFVFLVPLFLVKYLKRRAPDFFDWRSGVFELQDDDATLERQVGDCRLEDPSKIKELSEAERIQRALEIKDLLDNPAIQTGQRFRLLYDLGLIQAENVDFKSFRVSWQRASNLPVTEADNLCLKANVFKNLGRHEEAITSYEQAAELQPDNQDVWNNQGNILASLRRYEEAIVSYDKAIELKPDGHEAWYNRGNALVNLGRYEEAIISYDKALEIEPNKYIAWTNRGTALESLGKYEEALDSHEKALKSKSDYVLALYNKGVQLARLERYEEAIISCDKVLKFAPDNEDALFNQGNSLAILGRYEEALTSYERAVNINPNKHKAWHNYGVVLDELGLYDEAITSYDKALEIKPDKHGAWYNRGIAFKNLGRYEEAIASYERAVEIKPDFHDAWNNRGIALAELGRYKEAIASYERALDIKPDFELAQQNRRDALRKLRSPFRVFKSWLRRWFANDATP